MSKHKHKTKAESEIGLLPRPKLVKSKVDFPHRRRDRKKLGRSGFPLERGELL